MPNYHPYPEYKDSGIDWLGKIPTHWQTLKIKYIADLKSGDSLTSEAISDDAEYPVYGGNGFRGYTTKYTHEGVHPLIGRQGALCGNINYANGKFWASEHAVIVTPLKEANPFWLGELLRSMNLGQYSISAAQPGLAVDNIKNLAIPHPSITEQNQIAAFLNRETAKIDQLIAKQQQLIELLKEKRQAVISHAVTKGLNPNVKMKPSGVEWRGDVPEHWTVTRLKYHITLFEQGWSPQCDTRPAENGEYGVLKVGCVNYGKFNVNENKALPTELKPLIQYRLRKGDLLISRANTKELVGSAAIVDRDYEEILLCDKLYRIRFDENICQELIAYFLSTPIVHQQIELEASGASHSMQNIGQSTIKELFAALPPIEEALQLMAEIKIKTETFTSILYKSNWQIELLRERRAALISAAVTGKIDVREVALLA